MVTAAMGFLAFNSFKFKYGCARLGDQVRCWRNVGVVPGVGAGAVLGVGAVAVQGVSAGAVRAGAVLDVGEEICDIQRL